MPDKYEIQMLILLAGVFALMLVASLLMRWWDMRPRKMVDPARAAIARIKRMSILYRIGLFMLIWRIPRTSFYLTVGPENISDYAKEMTFSLWRMQEVILLGFMLSVFWAFAVYDVLKEIILKVAKEPDKRDGQRAA
jgi:hypothetical protein